jgi:hypothetical protein
LLVFSCGFKGFFLAEIVVQVIHKNANSFRILREHSSASKRILERENHFLSLTNSEKKADGGFYLYLIHVIHRPPVWDSDLTVVIDDNIGMSTRGCITIEMPLVTWQRYYSEA